MREWRDLRLYFRAMADVRRMRMVQEIAAAPELSVKDLCQRAGMSSQPLVSWHLRVLVRCGLVTTRRQGRQVLCTLNHPAFDAYQARVLQLIGERGIDEGRDVRTPLPARASMSVREA